MDFPWLVGVINSNVLFMCVRICTCVRQPERIYSSADRRMLRFQFLLFFTARIRYDTVCSTI